MTKVNIIIPAKNRAILAEQTIESLYANTPRGDFNLWIYLDGPDPETKAVVANLHTKYGFTLYENYESQGPGWCRNIVCQLLSHANERAKFLYHSDSDVYFKAGWLDNLIKAHELFGDTVKLFGAGCHPYHLTNEVLIKDGFSVYTKDAIAGFTAFMTWKNWFKYGPYIEFNGIMGSEDWAMCQKIVKDGFKVASLADEKVIHCGRTNSNGRPATGHELMGNIEGIKIL